MTPAEIGQTIAGMALMEIERLKSQLEASEAECRVLRCALADIGKWCAVTKVVTDSFQGVQQ